MRIKMQGRDYGGRIRLGDNRQRYGYAATDRVPGC